MDKEFRTRVEGELNISRWGTNLRAGVENIKNYTWTTLVIKWESDERKGIPVKTPSDNFKWNQLGELYQWFTDTYAQLSLQELKDRLNENINSIYAMIDSLSDEELFKPHMRKWADEATKTAVWEVYKFIHVNTVAPFGTFRTKIRKWKKIAL